MTTRRLLATITMFTLLFSLMPTPVQAVDTPSHLPSFTRNFTVPGTDARWFGNSLVVADGQAALTEYDPETGEATGTLPLNAPAVKMESSGGYLLVVTTKGTLYCFEPQESDQQPVLKWQQPGFANGRSFTADQVTITFLGEPTPDRALVAIGDHPYGVHLFNGAMFWHHIWPNGTMLDMHEVYGYQVFHYQNNDGYFIDIMQYYGVPIATLPASPAVVKGQTTTSFLYVAPDGHEVHEVDLEALMDYPLLTATNQVQSISQAVNTVITAGNMSFSWADDGVQSQYNDGDVSNGNYQTTAGNYFVTSPHSIAMFEDNTLSWGTTLTDGDATTAVLNDMGAAGFLLKLNQTTIALYAPSQNYFNFRQVGYSHSQTYVLEHPEAGTVSLDLCQGEYNPYLGVWYVVRYQAEGSSEWTLLKQDYLNNLMTTMNFPDVPAGQVKVSMFVDRRTAIDPELLPASNTLAHSPITVGLNLTAGLEGSLAAPPMIVPVNPGNVTYDLWNNPNATSVDWKVQTAPNGAVDFYGLELPLPVDANGFITQTVPIQNGIIQAVSGDFNGTHESVTIRVRTHLIKADPRVAPLLSRQPSITVNVPNAASFDLSQSTMLVGGVKVPLYANLQTNQIYGVPSASLPTGSQVVSLVLRGPANGDGTPSAVLDEADWQLEIIGQRVAVLWANKTSSLLNQGTVKLDAAPYITNKGVTMIPFRYVGDVMGAQVDWNSTTKEVSFRLKDRTVVLTIGSITAYVNGKAVTMLASPTLKNNRTLVPLRFVSEQLGAVVDWNGSKQQVTITVAADPAE